VRVLGKAVRVATGQLAGVQRDREDLAVADTQGVSEEPCKAHAINAS
jgi:hypothetical protein